jgi:hypothetical protein
MEYFMGEPVCERCGVPFKQERVIPAVDTAKPIGLPPGNGIDEEVFETIKYGMIMSLPIELRPNTNVMIRGNGFDQGFNFLQLKLRKLSLSRTLKTARYPADWWQAFRERWFPKRWLKKHPIKHLEISVRDVYPNYPLDDKWHSHCAFARVREEYPLQHEGAGIGFAEITLPMPPEDERTYEELD